MGYDANVTAETMNPVDNINLRVQLPEKIRLERCLVSQFGRQDTEIQFRKNKDWVEVTLPKLDAYAIVSFTDDKAVDVARRAAEKQRELDRKKVKQLANQYNLY